MFLPTASYPVIPQDPVLFNGTMRTNLDPFGVHGMQICAVYDEGWFSCSIDDARLWDALKRAYLVDQAKQSAEGEDDSQSRFSLNTPIEDEGGNLSVGQVRPLI